MKMSLLLHLLSGAIALCALFTAVNSQCGHLNFGCGGWQERMEQARVSAQAKTQKFASHSKMCECCCGQARCTSCNRCPIAQCHGYVLGKPNIVHYNYSYNYNYNYYTTCVCNYNNLCIPRIYIRPYVRKMVF